MCCMPSAKAPLTCLECPLHEEDDCTPHIVLDISEEKILVCYQKLSAPVIPEKFYSLLYKGNQLAK